MEVNEGVDINSRLRSFLLTSLSTVVLLLLFLLFEFVFLEDLPEFSICGLVIECASSNLFQIVAACVCPLVMGAKLSIKYNFGDFNIA